MAQFDVHRYRSPDPRVQFVVDLQAAAVRELDTRVVAPIYTDPEFAPRIERIGVPIMINDQRGIVLIYRLSVVRRTELGEMIWNISEHRDSIVRAIDFLFTGI